MGSTLLTAFSFPADAAVGNPWTVGCTAGQWVCLNGGSWRERSTYLTPAPCGVVCQVFSRLLLSHNNTLCHGCHLTGTYTARRQDVLQDEVSHHERPYLSLCYLALGLAELCSGGWAL